jgi:hypothetical protein
MVETVVATSLIRERKRRFSRKSKGVGEVYLCLVGVTQMRSLNGSDRMKTPFKHMRSPTSRYQ